MEFRIIQKISSHKDHANNFFVSANSTFFKLNKHKDVLPYKHSRVVLERSPYKTTEPEDGDDCTEFTYDHDEKQLQTYASACFVNSHVREFGKAFIASQAPEAGSVANFLQMVWDQDIKLMVMLCQQETDASNECLAYWEAVNQTSSGQVHNITVTSYQIVNDNLPTGVIKRIMMITNGL